MYTNTDSASFVNMQDNYDKEYMLVAVISKTESIKLYTLNKVKCLSD